MWRKNTALVLGVFHFSVQGQVDEAKAVLFNRYVRYVWYIGIDHYCVSIGAYAGE